MPAISRRIAPRHLSMTKCHEILARNGFAMKGDRGVIEIPKDHLPGIYIWGIIDKKQRPWKFVEARPKIAD